ncbi:unnamed protein product, partial [Rangifer tarandus platyrhynchus]
VGNIGLIPGLGSAHMLQLLKALKAVLHNERSHCNERPVHRNKEWPQLAPTRESWHTATKTQR